MKNRKGQEGGGLGTMIWFIIAFFIFFLLLPIITSVGGSVLDSLNLMVYEPGFDPAFSWQEQESRPMYPESLQVDREGRIYFFIKESDYEITLIQVDAGGSYYDELQTFPSTESQQIFPSSLRVSEDGKEFYFAGLYAVRDDDYFRIRKYLRGETSLGDDQYELLNKDSSKIYPETLMLSEWNDVYFGKRYDSKQVDIYKVGTGNTEVLTYSYDWDSSNNKENKMDTWSLSVDKYGDFTFITEDNWGNSPDNAYIKRYDYSENALNTIYEWNDQGEDEHDIFTDSVTTANNGKTYFFVRAEDKDKVSFRRVGAIDSFAPLAKWDFHETKPIQTNSVTIGWDENAYFVYKDDDSRYNIGKVDLPADAHEVDSDGDGLTDKEEAASGTDPMKADTDGDMYTDFFEIRSGSDPTNSSVIAMEKATYADSIDSCVEDEDHEGYCNRTQILVFDEDLENIINIKACGVRGGGDGCLAEANIQFWYNSSATGNYVDIGISGYAASGLPNWNCLEKAFAPSSSVNSNALKGRIKEEQGSWAASCKYLDALSVTITYMTPAEQDVV
ncbi:MAG: hypothetical protein ABIG20_02175 [archaeon]